jgi:tetratricopeptide (TPR) repeat protein
MSKKRHRGRSRKERQVARPRPASEPPPAKSPAALEPSSTVAAHPIETPLTFASPEVAPRQAEQAANVPPVVDLDAPFFRVAPRPAEGMPEPELPDPRLAAIAANAALRRAHFTKYVKGAVAFAAAVCVAALAKVAIGRNDAASDVRPQAEMVQAAAAVTLPRVEQAPAPEPPPAPTTHGVASSEPALAPAASQAVASDAAAGEQPAPAPGEAAAEMAIARVELERGRVAASIEAGERSVALDPSDGEAWLILGAAYQQKGNTADARRCYRTCVDQATRGPKGECAAMLR